MTTILDLPNIPRMADYLSSCSGVSRSRFAQDPEATLRDLGNGNTLLIGPNASVTLDPCATQVWRALDGQAVATIPELTARFAPKGDEWHILTRRFVYALIMALLARGLVHEVKALPRQIENPDTTKPPAWWSQVA